MMTTILGQHISNIRLAKPSKSIVYKSERSYVRYQSRTATIKQNCGAVKSICVEASDGYIYSISKGTHLDILEAFSLDPEDVIRTGWELENGKLLWR
jgi:hypothetical protein